MYVWFLAIASFLWFFSLLNSKLHVHVYLQLADWYSSICYIASRAKNYDFFFCPLIGQSCNICHFVGIQFQLQKQHEQSGIGTSVQSSCPSNFFSSHLSLFKSLSLHKVPFHLIGLTMTFVQLLILHSMPDPYFKVIYNYT